MTDESKPKTLTLFLTATPFGAQSATTTLNLAEAALDKGYKVNLFLSADAVYGSAAGQKAAGLPQVGERLPALIAKGLRVDLCGSCLQLRGLRGDMRMEGPQPSSLKNLFTMVAESKAFVALGR
ncbi:MAG TPA: DsrE family protein [Symbiobacteriaceae bacterium]|jgi:tRNA 2-thiouridine synthesizing protein D